MNLNLAESMNYEPKIKNRDGKNKANSNPNKANLVRRPVRRRLPVLRSCSEGGTEGGSGREGGFKPNLSAEALAKADFGSKNG